MLTFKRESENRNSNVSQCNPRKVVHPFFVPIFYTNAKYIYVKGWTIIRANTLLF